MITKISSSEYLRRVDNMDAAERESYLARVGEWLEKQAPLLVPRMSDPLAVFQNAIQCSAGWNDDACQAWTDGARLLTALAKSSETWLPDMLYIKAAKRAIRQMVTVLRTGSGFFAEQSGRAERKVHVSGDRDGIAGQQTKQVAKEESAEGTGMATQAVAPPTLHSPLSTLNSPLGSAASPSEELSTLNSVSVARPKHIDQYVHLLPQKTQERAATVKGLLRDLDVARENMRLLMEDPNSKSDSRESWAKTATAIDAKVKAIYKELDAEWGKLVQQGRVVVDDLGNARVVEVSAGTVPSATSEAEAKAAEEKAKRIEYLKKWLRDTRTKASDERKKQWEQNCKELLALGGEVTDSIRKAAEYYGVGLKTE